MRMEPFPVAPALAARFDRDIPKPATPRARQPGVERGETEGMSRKHSSEHELDELIRRTVLCLNQPDADAGLLAGYLRDLSTADWQSRLNGAARTWERFCREFLSCEAADLQETLAGASALRQAGLLNPTVAQAREALRFEVDCELMPPPPEEAVTPLERLQLDWLQLTPQERDEFLTWALAQQGETRKKPRGKSKRKK
jgi:hypothetical protein